MAAQAGEGSLSWLSGDLLPQKHIAIRLRRTGMTGILSAQDINSTGINKSF